MSFEYPEYSPVTATYRMGMKDKVGFISRGNGDSKISEFLDFRRR